MSGDLQQLADKNVANIIAANVSAYTARRYERDRALRTLGFDQDEIEATDPAMLQHIADRLRRLANGEASRARKGTGAVPYSFNRHMTIQAALAFTEAELSLTMQEAAE